MGLWYEWRYRTYGFRQRIPNQSPAQRVRFGAEEQRRERALTFEKSRSKRYKACSDVVPRPNSNPNVGIFTAFWQLSIRVSITLMDRKQHVAEYDSDNYGTGIPYHEAEALARVLLPEIQAFFESEEGQREFAEWKARQEADTTNRHNTQGGNIYNDAPVYAKIQKL